MSQLDTTTTSKRALWLFLPVVLNFVIIAAHFLRSGTLWMSALLLACPLMLLIRHWLAARFIQLMLLLISFDWLLTTAYIVNERISFGSPWQRAAMILVGVALFCFLSCFVFINRSLKARYGLGRS
ncbi:hypothetical protein [Pelagibaculum spongiae]|uniref:DUF2069 domain-containing protein n=1 Tax=Pelagibaculum spongiae TaxID=2080658 RepID=A0A2V1GXV7_9GAMM|nr:hypothetical protein [Pelagibaculum spongiae]PVZ70473.1 hypothetical protein DC094_07775 [Pelagibaculum spongiae]